MLLRLPHIESDKVSSGVCVFTSVLLITAAVVALIKFGEYVMMQISSLF